MEYEESGDDLPALNKKERKDRELEQKATATAATAAELPDREPGNPGNGAGKSKSNSDNYIENVVNVGNVGLSKDCSDGNLASFKRVSESKKAFEGNIAESVSLIKKKVIDLVSGGQVAAKLQVRSSRFLLVMSIS